MKNRKNIIIVSTLVLILVVVLVLTINLASCGNMQLIDTTFRFDRAIISLPNGEVVEGKVQQWGDYEDSDQIQVKIDGKTYLVHSNNVVLISE